MRENLTGTVALPESGEQALLACAVAAAKDAGNYVLRNIARRGEVARRLKHDVKLKLDIESQARAEAVIRRHFPDHAILGEEDPEDAARPPVKGVEWIIDPIDGTVNFSHGLPLWCCSVAVRKGRKFLAGAIYAPVLRELYTATRSGPALKNGKKLAVSKVASISDSIVFTGVDKNIDRGVLPYTVFGKLTANVQRTRVMGCAALDICKVACGQGEGYYESGIFIWDIAAAGLIVQRAGGKVEILLEEAGNRMSFLATNGKVHGALRNLIQPT